MASSPRTSSSASSATCFSPWELASLKVVYHQFDDRHKGYLNPDDLLRVCAACHLILTPEEFKTLVLVMDSNGDGRFSFEEFVTFLALSGPEHPDAVQMRERLMRADVASLTAGAALGILPFVKGKLFVILGTLFYDPIRLFRDSFVDYSATLRHRLHVRKQRGGGGGGSSTSSSSSAETLVQVLKAHASGSHAFKTALWLTYTVSLDCVVGAAMFLSYSRARRWCIEQSEVIQQHRRLRLESISASDPGTACSLSAGGSIETACTAVPRCAVPTTTKTTFDDRNALRELTTVSHLLREELLDEAHRKDWQEHPILSLQRIVEVLPGLAMNGHPLRLEAVAGAVGGAVSGLLQGPCHYLATFGNAHIGNTIYHHHHASVDDAAATMATDSATQREGRRGRKWVYHHTTQAAERFHRGCFLAFRGTVGAVFRNAASHSAFFSAFAGAKAVMLRSCFGPDAWLCSLHRTTLHDTWVTAAAGCAAGAAYRTVSVPIINLQRGYYSYLAEHSPASVHANLLRTTQIQPWVLHSVRSHYYHQYSAIAGPSSSSLVGCVSAGRRFLFRGYGESLLCTMPATGVAFLVYEIVLLRT